MWNLCNRDLVLRGHHGRIQKLAFSPDGQILASAGDDHTVKLWQMGKGTELTTFTGHDRAVCDLAFSLDGQELFTGSFDGSIRRWNVRDLCPKGIVWKEKGAVLSLARAPDGAHLAFYTTAVNPLTNHTDIRFLDLQSGSIEASDSWSRSLWSLDYSPDGRLLAESGGIDHKARIWDTTSRTVSTILSGHDGQTFAACFSPDGRLLATASLDGTVRLWHPASGTELARQTCPPGPNALAFSADSRVVAFTLGNAIHLWNLVTKQVNKIETAHLGLIDALAFSRSENAGDRGQGWHGPTH